VKIGSVDPEIIGPQEIIKKEIFQAKHIARQAIWSGGLNYKLKQSYDVQSHAGTSNTRPQQGRNRVTLSFDLLTSCSSTESA